MTTFEFLYLYLEPFMTALYSQVRRELRASVMRFPGTVVLLDVGGRKSHYTIGLNADVTVSDLPRQTDLQHRLNLGITTPMMNQLRRRRSNIGRVVYDDMTSSKLPAETYDIIVAVEVLEHIETDDCFIKHVCRLLRPGGMFFMTTPNGDAIPNTNPDHKRHYRLSELDALLSAHFPQREVWYAVPLGFFQRVGARGSWSVHKPLRTMARMGCGLLHNLQSKLVEVRCSSARAAHLFARATNVR